MPQRQSVDYTVYLDHRNANDYIEISRMVDSVGAQRLDTAVLVHKLADVEDFDHSTWIGLEVEIVRTQTSEVVHWGKIELASPLLSAELGEILTLTSRADRFLLGGKITGAVAVWDPRIAAPIEIYLGGVVFNPEIDGNVYGNENNTFTSPDTYLFLDPESVRTAAARTYQGANITPWPLSQAVHYLLWTHNPNQPYVSNRPIGDLYAIFDDANDLIKDVHLPLDMYLCDALDALLIPLGYHWFIERRDLVGGDLVAGQLPADSGRRRFQFVKRGSGGALVTVSHQRWGEKIDNTKTRVITSGVQFDASRLANHVACRGGLAEFEVTVELARGWAAASDSLTSDDLIKDGPGWDATKKDVWRKWVLNEAGDYIGLRTEINGLWTAAFRSTLSGLSLHDFFVAHRRKLLPTLTLNPDNTPIGQQKGGIEIEYSNAASPEWKPITWGMTVLEHEGGVYFDGDRLPEEFFFYPANMRIRATFTLAADLRLQGLAAAVLVPQPDVVPVVLDLRKQFRFRQVTTASKYSGSGLPSLATDDTTAIGTFAAYVSTIWNLLDIGGPIELEGLDNTYQLGSRVEKIAIKNLPFEAKPASGKYPQIVAIEKNVTNQTTTLHLERFSEPLDLYGNQRDRMLANRRSRGSGRGGRR
jgi:hypothetical protein